MKVILSGYYGFDNAGDEALLSAITSSLHQLQPGVEITVLSGNPQKTTRLYGLKAVHYMNPLRLISELGQADLLISGGGSIFQDITSARSLPYYISVVALAKLLRKPVIFYAQGVGPINRPLSKWLMRKIANRVELITLRDEESRQLLLRLGVNRPEIRVTADPVFSLKPDEEDFAAVEPIIAGLQDPNQPIIGVSVRQWEPLQGYQQQLARTLDELNARGYQILFIPMAYPDDIDESRQVAKFMTGPYQIVEQNLSSQQHLALISRLYLMVGMRLHALIFAASRGVPFAGISYDPKVDAFLNYFRLEPLSLNYEEMLQALQSLLNDQQGREQILKEAQTLRQKSQLNAKLALSLVVKK
ncbi:MAG: polysaccharide pyruvyl transferase CsaB [Syntrophomonadaceae bacterium]|jgi:polysaccharide pyruvyl transferase CsaB